MDDKEQLKRELNIIIGVSEKYDLRDVANVKKLCSYYETKVELKTSIGKKYLNRLRELENGADVCFCIICNANISADGVICSACMEKMSQGKRSIYCQRDNTVESPVNDKRKEKTNKQNKKSDDGKGSKVLLKKVALAAINVIVVAAAFIIGKNYGEGRFEAITQRFFPRKTSEESLDTETTNEDYPEEVAHQEPFVEEENEDDGYSTEQENDYGFVQSDNQDFGVENYDANDYVQADYDPYDYGEENYDADDYDYGEENYDADDYDYGVENYDADDYGIEPYDSGEHSGIAGNRITIYPDVKNLDFSMLDISEKTYGKMDEVQIEKLLYDMYPQSDGWIVEYKCEMNFWKMTFWGPVGYETSLVSSCLMKETDQKWFEIGKEDESVYRFCVMNYGAKRFVYPYANSDGRIVATGQLVDEKFYTESYRIR